MTIEPTTVSPSSIVADTTLGTVRLTVSDPSRSAAFYEGVLGLSPRELENGTIALGVPGAPALIELHGDGAAPALDHRRTGLFHLAVLVPSRRDLAFALTRLAYSRWPLTGASDHLVSEAVYLNDPDGNGIELYRDRPRDEWPHKGGQLQMATIPLDLDDVLGEIGSSDGAQPSAPDGTRIGHVHLQVADLRDTESFYAGVLGFEVMVRGYPGALFVAAGGYHHHIGLNTWNSAGAAAPEPGSVGLGSFEVILPDEASLERVLARVRASGREIEAADAGALVRDPSGNGVLLRT